MTRQSFPLGRILGIPIGLDYSWFLIFALLTWTLGGSYNPAEFKNWPPLLYWFMGAVTAIMLFASVLLHELGHSVVATRIVPRGEWQMTSAAQAMLPLDKLMRISPDEELWTALQQMDRGGVNQLPVMTDKQVVGMLSREDVITFLRTVQELAS